MLYMKSDEYTIYFLTLRNLQFIFVYIYSPTEKYFFNVIINFIYNLNYKDVNHCKYIY